MAYDDLIQNLVVARLRTMPPNVKFSIGSYGAFTKDELILQVKERTETGEAFVKMDLEYIRAMPKLSAILSEEVSLLKQLFFKPTKEELEEMRNEFEPWERLSAESWAKIDEMER